MTKEVAMEIDWRVVQFFISEDGVAEAEVDSENPNRVRCSCQRFSVRGRCKHVTYIKEKMAENEGHYQIKVPYEVPDDEAILAISTAKRFRDFILKYGTVISID
jgi:hypothetical protein